MLEEWYRRHLGPDIHDISSSGVHPYTFAEIRELCGIPAEDLDAVVMDDSVSQGAPASGRRSPTGTRAATPTGYWSPTAPARPSPSPSAHC